MAWAAIYETGTGWLISIGDVIADPLPAGLSKLDLAGEPDLSPDADMWDETTRTFITRPPKVIFDRLQDLLTHPRFADFITDVWSNLNPAQRTRVRNVLSNWLGRARWRAQTQNETIEPED